MSTRARTKEIQRLEKLLEDSGIKLSVVASNIVGVSGRAMLEALIGGQRDPAVLADLAKQRLRQKIPALTEALRGRFTDHHAFMARLYLDCLDEHNAKIERLDERIEEAMKPFRATRELLISIPGFSRIVAEVFIAETGVGVAALSASRSKNTYYAAKFKRIAARRGRHGALIALVAVEHHMLIDAWNMLGNGAFHRDLGGDYYTRRNPERTKARAINQLHALGYRVTVEPLAPAG